MSVVYKGDVGTLVIVTIVDQNLAVVMLDVDFISAKILFQKPSGVVVEKTAALYTDGKDGKIYYTTQTGDIDESGQWKIEGRIKTAAGEWASTIFNLTVSPALVPTP